MRYVYIKNGDAVDQVRRFAELGIQETSGPDAFIGDFLSARHADDVLVQSRWTTADEFRNGRIVARCTRASPTFLPRAFGRAWSAIAVGWQTFSWRPDRILCGCTGELLWVSVLAAKLLGVQIVHSRHNEVQVRKGLARIAQKLDEWCMAACNGLVCHGPYLAQQIQELQGQRIPIYSFEVDLRPFVSDEAGRAKSTALDEIRLRHEVLMLFVGRVQSDKGVFDLLHAYQALPSDLRERAALVYVGDGLDLERLRQQIRHNGLSDDVLLLGRISHPTLPGVIRSCDVTITPTRPDFPEGRCMVVLESLALGVPVVAPCFGPFPFAVEHGVNGMLYEPGSVEALGRCLELIVQDGESLRQLKRGAAATSNAFMLAPSRFANAVDMAFGDRNGGG